MTGLDRFYQISFSLDVIKQFLLVFHVSEQILLLSYFGRINWQLLFSDSSDSCDFQVLSINLIFFLLQGARREGPGMRNEGEKEVEGCRQPGGPSSNIKNEKNVFGLKMRFLS